VTAIDATSPAADHSEANSRHTSSGEDGDNRIERLPKLEMAHAADAELASTTSRPVFEPVPSPKGGVVRSTGHLKSESTSAPDPSQIQLETQSAKPPATPRDIRLEVNSGEQRVELHLVDRGGDVHVSVRTPDTHLAGELRENLPALSSRLEQTGLHAEEWHASTPGNGESHRHSEHSAGSGAHNPNGQSGQHAREQQEDAEQHPPKVFQEQVNPKEKGKEFAWFMSPLH
jgi:hypothetical protein